MKKKIYFIVDKGERIEEVFLTKTAAFGWIARYKSAIPIGSDTFYYNRYKIVSHLVGKQTL